MDPLKSCSLPKRSQIDFQIPYPHPFLSQKATHNEPNKKDFKLNNRCK